MYRKILAAYREHEIDKKKTYTYVHYKGEYFNILNIKIIYIFVLLRVLNFY